MYLAYSIVTSIAAPIGALWLAANAKYRPLLRRFCPDVPDLGEARPFWVHACSVGEVNTARPIVKALQSRHPDRPVVLTTSTISGHDLAVKGEPEVAAAWLPFDHPLSVSHFVQRLRPRALLLLETELWPALLHETRRAGVPVVVVNGRLSDKHYAKYLRYKALIRPVLRQVSLAAMQNEEYVQRLVALGADPERVRAAGCTKFDGVTLEADPERVSALREECGLADAPVLTFGSTRPGDEALAASCWRTLRDKYPDLRLVIAVRHANRLGEAVAPFDEPFLLRSELLKGRRPAGERVLFVDTVGELISFYALSTLAVIGGSFYPGVNGHNPLESAALAIPTVFGSYMRNFIDPARELVEHDGAIQVPSPERLLPVLCELIEGPGRRARIAANGRNAVLANQGAIVRTLDLLDSVLALEG